MEPGGLEDCGPRVFFCAVVSALGVLIKQGQDLKRLVLLCRLKGAARHVDNSSTVLPKWGETVVFHSVYCTILTPSVVPQGMRVSGML